MLGFVLSAEKAGVFNVKTLKVASATGDPLAKFASKAVIEERENELWDEFQLGVEYNLVLIERNEDKDSRGFVLNVGNEPLHLTYEKDGKQTGPTTDTIQPGSYREIWGEGGIKWRLCK